MCLVDDSLLVKKPANLNFKKPYRSIVLEVILVLNRKEKPPFIDRVKTLQSVGVRGVVVKVGGFVSLLREVGIAERRGDDKEYLKTHEQKS